MALLLIRLLGLFLIAIGIAGLVAAKKTTSTLCNMVKNAKRQTLGLINLIVGALLLLAGPAAKEAWFVMGIGVISCLKGLSVVLMPPAKTKAIIDWWLAAPEAVNKGWAAFALILGVALFYAA